MKHVYFPGCTADSLNSPASKATLLVLSALDEEIIIPEGFTCCGGSHLEKLSKKQTKEINIKNLKIAKQYANQVFTSCNTCFMELSKVKDEVDMRVLSTLHLLDQINFSPLKTINKKIIPFYGCHILRPKLTNQYSEGILERLITHTGAEVVDYPYKDKCCGFHSILTNRSVTENIIKEAIDTKADLIVTPCILCHHALDMFQGKIQVLHISQLIGLSLGIPARKLGINKNVHFKRFKNTSKY